MVVQYNIIEKRTIRWVGTFLITHIIPLVVLCGLSACGQNMHIKSERHRTYVMEDRVLRNEAPVMQEIKKKDKEKTYATISFFSKDEPDSEVTTILVKRKYRAYMLEAPIGGEFSIGEKKVQTMFDIGYHRDHKAFAGFVFVMPF